VKLLNFIRYCVLSITLSVPPPPLTHHHQFDVGRSGASLLPSGPRPTVEASVAEHDASWALPNLNSVGGILVRTGGADATVSPYFSRRLHRELVEARSGSGGGGGSGDGSDLPGHGVELAVIPGKGHWWWDTESVNDGGAVWDRQVRATVGKGVASAKAHALWAVRGGCAGDGAGSGANSSTTSAPTRATVLAASLPASFSVASGNPGTFFGARGFRILASRAPGQRAFLHVTLAAAPSPSRPDTASGGGQVEQLREAPEVPEVGAAVTAEHEASFECRVRTVNVARFSLYGRGGPAVRALVGGGGPAPPSQPWPTALQPPCAGGLVVDGLRVAGTDLASMRAWAAFPGADRLRGGGGSGSGGASADLPHLDQLLDPRGSPVDDRELRREPWRFASLVRHEVRAGRDRGAPEWELTAAAAGNDVFSSPSSSPSSPLSSSPKSPAAATTQPARWDLVEKGPGAWGPLRQAFARPVLVVVPQRARDGPRPGNASAAAAAFACGSNGFPTSSPASSSSSSSRGDDCDHNRKDGNEDEDGWVALGPEGGAVGSTELDAALFVAASHFTATGAPLRVVGEDALWPHGGCGGEPAAAPSPASGKGAGSGTGSGMQATACDAAAEALRAHNLVLVGGPAFQRRVEARLRASGAAAFRRSATRGDTGGGTAGGGSGADPGPPRVPVHVSSAGVSLGDRSGAGAGATTHTGAAAEACGWAGPGIGAAFLRPRWAEAAAPEASGVCDGGGGRGGRGTCRSSGGSGGGGGGSSDGGGPGVVTVLDVVVTGTDARGLRLATSGVYSFASNQPLTRALFTSAFGDFFVAGPRLEAEGLGGVLAHGFFDRHWGLAEPPC